MPLGYPGGHAPIMRRGMGRSRTRGTVRPTVMPTANFTISGIVKSNSGVPQPNAIVKLYRTSDDLLVAQTTSDVLGAYSFAVGENASRYYVVAYLPGAPDTMGTTANTVLAT